MPDLKLYLVDLVLFVVFGPFILAAASTAYERCSSFSFACCSGECIPIDDVCDGIPHCVDGSDETAAQCIHTPCPLFAFRCAYGACITGTARCNGHRDCADGSDETLLLCTSNLQSTIDELLQGNCSSSKQFRCLSGECINQEDSCDGIAHCRDASDETVELCSHLYCPVFAFRCGYGGCIRGNAKCDGFSDCYDGSDEVAALCGRPPQCPSTVAGMNVSVTGPVPAALPSPQSPPSVPSLPSLPSPPRAGCLVPFHRRHLVAKIADTGVTVELGDTVPSDTIVLFRCNGAKRQLEGEQRNACVNSMWLHKVPNCKKYCPVNTLQRGISTTVASCRLGENLLTCTRKQLVAGVVARIECAPGYRPRDYAAQTTQTLHCDDDAEWDFPKMKCTPDCGILSVQQSQAGSREAKPWDVTVFRRANAASMYVRQCSGTIITPKLVLTAASCLKSAFDPINYNVVEGIYSYNYREGDNSSRTKHAISRIVTSTFYDDRFDQRPETTGSNEPELATLVLVKYFIFGPYLTPICLNFPDDYSFDPAIDVRTIGPPLLLDVGRAIYGIPQRVERFVLTGIIAGNRTIAGEQQRIDMSNYVAFLRKQLRRYPGPL